MADSVLKPETSIIRVGGKKNKDARAGKVHGKHLGQHLDLVGTETKTKESLKNISSATGMQ